MEGVTDEEWYELFDIRLTPPSVDDPPWLTAIGMIIVSVSYLNHAARLFGYT